MIGVDDQLGARALTGCEHRAEVRDDVRVSVQHRRHEHRGSAFIDGARKPFGQRGRRLRGHFHHFDPFFGEAVELAADRMELPVGRDQSRPLAQG